MSAKGDLKKIGVELQKNHVVTVPQGGLFRLFFGWLFSEIHHGTKLESFSKKCLILWTIWNKIAWRFAKPILDSFILMKKYQFVIWSINIRGLKRPVVNICIRISMGLSTVLNEWSKNRWSWNILNKIIHCSMLQIFLNNAVL